MDKINSEILLKLGFVLKQKDSLTYFDKDGYILTKELNVWRICTGELGEILATNQWIETIEELFRHYQESIGEKLIEK